MRCLLGEKIVNFQVLLASRAAYSSSIALHQCWYWTIWWYNLGSKMEERLIVKAHN